MQTASSCRRIIEKMEACSRATTSSCRPVFGLTAIAAWPFIARVSVDLSIRQVLGADDGDLEKDAGAGRQCFVVLLQRWVLRWISLALLPVLTVSRYAPTWVYVAVLVIAKCTGLQEKAGLEREVLGKTADQYRKIAIVDVRCFNASIRPLTVSY